jgi:hypothetical protein
MFLNNENKGVLTVASFAITQMANASNSLYGWQSIELAFEMSFLACTERHANGLPADFASFSGPVSMPVCPGNLFKLITYHKSRNFIHLACITTVVQFPFG